MEIIDNFLSNQDFKILEKTILGNSFPFYFNPYILNPNEKVNLSDINFTHMVYEGKGWHKERGIMSSFYDLIYSTFIIKFKINTLHRVKVNCYPRTSRNITHKFHADSNFSHKGALLSLNTCNGSTKIKGHRRVKSIANRLIVFDPSILHASESCTNQKCRWNIIINYS